MWTAFGLLAYAALAFTGGLVDGHPTAGRWIGSIAFLLAGLYQLGPLKHVCLRHCRDPLSHLVRYAGFRRPARDLRVGVHHGAYCVGCCAGPMAVLIPVGVMNVAAMTGLALVIFMEKLWSWGLLLTSVVGVASSSWPCSSRFRTGCCRGCRARCRQWTACDHPHMCQVTPWRSRRLVSCGSAR
ncbi:hypothetical protein GCM10022233_40760 [Streptomyces shaanxiensis]|uniref:DUF2182 domain-containing protein n=1 Tax=Streptomyces shaanxiensis TaxID=653357 RepID=A0ABP7VA25_9ACTN